MKERRSLMVRMEGRAARIDPIGLQYMLLLLLLLLPR